MLFSRAHRRRLAAALRGGEGGFAMIVSMLVITVVAVMTLGMLATGLHLQAATARDSSWNKALQVAEAGVDNAVYHLTDDPTFAQPGPVAGTVPQGTFSVSVVKPKRGWLVVTSTGTVGKVKRRIEVTYGPAASFKFALFSDTGLEVKNNNGTTGDIFANQSIVLKQNSGVKGSVVSATGTIDMENNAQIQKNNGQGGNAYSGGYDAAGRWGIRLQNNAVIQGDAYAQEETCSPPDTTNYNISNAGSVLGNAVAGGAINGSVGGTSVPFNCQLRQPTRLLPQYHYDPDLYGDAIEDTSAAAFQTWADAHSGSLTGTHRVCDGGPDANGQCTSQSLNSIDLGGKTITGDFTLITNTLIDFNNNAAYLGPSDAFVSLISLNDSTDPPAINIKNNFSIPDPSPAVLVYSSGLIYVKNNAESNGAVYAGAISINNNLDVTYDPRVERTLGFGPTRYERVTWKELTPS